MRGSWGISSRRVSPPSRADVGRARVHWAGADARFDATLEALLLDDRLASPSSVSPSRPRLRM